MSRKVVELVYSRRVGSMSRKAVLVEMADRANDDGSGVWISKVRIAAEVECSKQTVINVIKQMLEEGILHEAGTRPCESGYTVSYNLDLDAIRSLPPSCKSEDDTEGSNHLTGPKLDRSKTGPVKTAKRSNWHSQEVNPVDPNRPEPSSSSSFIAEAREDGPIWKRDPWSDAIFAAAGPGLADPAKDHRVWLDLNGRLSRWRMAGWDIDLDIVPVIAAKTSQARHSPMWSFKFLEDDIGLFRAKRLQAAPQPVELPNERSGQSYARNGSARPGGGYRSSSLTAGYQMLHGDGE